MATKTMTPCKCRQYAVETLEGLTGIDCDRETVSNFAPGHDAKLKSLLINAGANGHAIVKTTEEGEQNMSAQDAANEFAFGAHVEKGITKQAERAQAKANREAERLAKRDAKKVAPGPARAKVGRKEHDGEVLADGLTFQYDVTTGEGDEATTETKTSQRFRVVPADAEVANDGDDA